MVSVPQLHPQAPEMRPALSTKEKIIAALRMGAEQAEVIDAAKPARNVVDLETERADRAKETLVMAFRKRLDR